MRKCLPISTRACRHSSIPHHRVTEYSPATVPAGITLRLPRGALPHPLKPAQTRKARRAARPRAQGPARVRAALPHRLRLVPRRLVREERRHALPARRPGGASTLAAIPPPVKDESAGTLCRRPAGGREWARPPGGQGGCQPAHLRHATPRPSTKKFYYVLTSILAYVLTCRPTFLRTYVLTHAGRRPRRSITYLPTNLLTYVRTHSRRPSSKKFAGTPFELRHAFPVDLFPHTE